MHMGRQEIPTNLPLSGLRILVTRSGDDAERDAEALHGLGADVERLPVIRIVPPGEWDALDTALRSLNRYQWLAFTSRNAVQPVVERLESLTLRVPRNTRVASVGAATSAALRAAGMPVDLEPDHASAHDLAAALLAAGAAGKRVLHAAGNRARPEFSTALRSGGARVDSLEVYRAVASVPADRELPAGLDVIALFSPSAFRALVDRFGAGALERVELACIGTTTAAAVADAGLRPSVVAREQSSEGMARAIAEARMGRE